MVAEQASAPSAIHPFVSHPLFPPMMASSSSQPSVAWPPPGIGAQPVTGASPDPGASAAAPGPEAHKPGEAKRFRDRDYGPLGPLTSFQELADVVRRIRQQQEAHHRDVTEAFADHAARIDVLEQQDLQYNDRIAYTADFCTKMTQDADKKLRAQLDAFAVQLKTDTETLKVGLETMVAAAQAEFESFRGDAKVLTDQVDLKILQIQAGLRDHEDQLMHLHGAVGDQATSIPHFAINTPQRDVTSGPSSPCRRSAGPAGCHPARDGASGVQDFSGISQGQRVEPAGGHRVQGEATGVQGVQGSPQGCAGVPPAASADPGFLRAGAGFLQGFSGESHGLLTDPPDLLRGISLTDPLDRLRGIIMGMPDLLMDFSKDSANFPQERTGPMQDFLMSLQEPTERTGPMEVFLKSPQEFTERTGPMQDSLKPPQESMERTGPTQDSLKAPQEVMDMPEFLEFFTAALSLTEGQYR